jgi:lipoprotein-anchoring transpeptidase ErfK/SrfK
MLLCVILCAGAALPARGQDATATGRGVAQASAEAKPTYRTRAQEKIKDLVAAGETDIDELVKVIASDDREALDHVVINIATQRLYECNLEGQVLAEHKVSSGRVGFDTPPGEYHIVNKAPKAYSKKYSAWMLYWMGLTSNGDYGMHGLEGSSYERLLGSQASHGCVRLSREYAKALYPRVKVGMPVTIVKDAKLNLAAYEPLSKQAAISLVLDAISPADPWEAYY